MPRNVHSPLPGLYRQRRFPAKCIPPGPKRRLKPIYWLQISLALNRIWTEWYPSRGYSFNITGSPAVDQAYTEGRTVYAVMERLTAELFNTYVRRSGDAEPYFTEYCDGKLVNCNGMSQWGTVDRAREGKTALEILRYYYGSRVELARSTNLTDIPQSYPGRRPCAAAIPAPRCARSSGSFPALRRTIRPSASRP